MKQCQTLLVVITLETFTDKSSNDECKWSLCKESDYSRKGITCRKFTYIIDV
jgi:hypothetical protein